MRHLPQNIQQFGRMTRPFAIVGLHRAKEQFQLLNRYAIARQYAQHLYEQICNKKRDRESERDREKERERDREHVMLVCLFGVCAKMFNGYENVADAA